MSDAPHNLSAVAIVAHRSGQLQSALKAVRVQSAPFSSITILGGGPAAKTAARDAEVSWVPGATELVGELAAEVTHVWFVHDDAKPRPDALSYLLSESERVDASVAGSKLVHLDDPDRLESVGGATDLLCYPVTGLEVGEVDQGQYDLIRDVAFVPSASVLIRKDLFAGLGGPDPLMAPVAAGIDFAQRARLAGGRVVVVPSSEVLHGRVCSESIPRWREQAGEMRALLKGYSWISLMWVLPVAAIVWLLAALLRLVTGHPLSLLNLVKSVAWNLKNIGSLFAGRSQLRKARHVGDEELFRYQSRGFESFRQAWLAVLNPLRARVAATTENDGGLQERSTSKTLATTGVLGLCWAAISRSVLFGDLPVAGWSIPLGDRAQALAASSGSWNGAGFGTDLPPHPSAALLAAGQWVLGNAPERRLTLFAVALGLIGAFRFFRKLDLGEWSAVGGAVVVIGGPATVLLGQGGSWNGLLGLGALPWMALWVTAPHVRGWKRSVARAGSLGLASGFLAAMSPAAVVLPVAMGLLAAVFYKRTASLVWGVIGTAFAVPFVGSWVVNASVTSLLEVGTGFYWKPTLLLLASVGAAWLFSMWSPERSWRAASVGGVLAVIAAVGLRSFPDSRELFVTGSLTLALGLGTVAAGAFSSAGSSNRGIGRSLGVVAAVGVAVLMVSNAGPAWNGSLGMTGSDGLDDLRGFMNAREHAPGSRMLLLETDVPGDSRLWEGLEYRVIDTDLAYADAILGPKGTLDLELEQALSIYVSDPPLRASKLFKEFGLQWLALPSDSHLLPVFQGRLDLLELAVGDYVLFEFDRPVGVAVADSGQFWSIEAEQASGPTADTVAVAINSTDRFASISGDDSVVLLANSGSVDATVDSQLEQLALLLSIWAATLAGFVVVGKLDR